MAPYDIGYWFRKVCQRSAMCLRGAAIGVLIKVKHRNLPKEFMNRHADDSHAYPAPVDVPS
jgi:alpha-D-ribose 1-methylphosphonate 5-triphosphate synthase subunit PhnH